MAAAQALPYARDPSHKPSRVRRATVTILVFLWFNLALGLHHVVPDDDVCGALAFVVACQLNATLIFCAFILFVFAPQGSPARGRARLAGCLLTTTLTAAFAWKIGALLPLGLGVAGWAWVAGAATVSGGFYALFLWWERFVRSCFIVWFCVGLDVDCILQ